MKTFYRKVTLFTSSIIICLVCCISAFSDTLPAPEGLTIYSNSTGGIDVFWFFPGLHELSLGNLEYLPFRVGVASTQSESAIFTRWTLIPPFYIDSVHTYLINADSLPAFPGDKFVPLNVSIRHSMALDTSTLLWSGGLVLDANSIFDWVLVSTPIGLSFSAEDEIFTAFEWYQPYLAAPQIGVIGNYILDQHYLIKRTNGYETQECFEEYSAGLKLLNWTANSQNRTVSSEQLTFELRYASDTANFVSNSVLAGTADADSLHLSAIIPDDAYLAIVSRDSLNEAVSEYLRYDSTHCASLQLAPADFNVAYQPGTVNYYSVSLENRGSETLEPKFLTVSPNLKISPESLALGPGEIGEIIVEFDAAGIIDTLFGSYIIAKLEENYYPLIYFLRFHEDKPLIVDDDPALIPTGFEVGQPYPNPFNSVISIPLDSPPKVNLDIRLYNLLGQELLRKYVTTSLEKSITLEFNSANRQVLPTGVYFIRISNQTHTAVRRAILLK